MSDVDAKAVQWLRETAMAEQREALDASAPYLDIAAWAEMTLAILDVHDVPEHYCPLPVLPSVHGQRWTPAEGPCWTIRLLAAGWRYRPGFAEHWGNDE